MSRFQLSREEYEAIKAAEAGQIVTVKEIKAAFDKVRGKDTGRGYIYMLLKRHGWRKAMPRSSSKSGNRLVPWDSGMKHSKP